jgi:hypothetical protein
MTAGVRTSPWFPRTCPICERSDLMVAIGERTSMVRQRTRVFEWQQTDGLCSGCGLIQSLRAPEAAFLDEYYADAHSTRTTAQQALVSPSFNTPARLSSIRKFHRGGRLLEVGAADGAFCELLRQEGIDAVGVDPLGDQESEFVVSGYASDGILATGSADTVVAYHVMEHATDPLGWLQSIRLMLTAEGTLIIEVPDVANWPVDAWHHEHFTQFDQASLQTLLEHAGFATVSCGVESPSRPHGIVYVGRPRPAQDARARAMELYERAERTREGQSIAATRTADRVLGEVPTEPGRDCEVIVWGANEIASAIGSALQHVREDLTIRVVDNADSKAGVPHPGFPNPVERPVFHPVPGKRMVFVLCSRVWNHAIAEQISGMGLADVAIVDGTDWPTD